MDRHLPEVLTPPGEGPLSKACPRAMPEDSWAWRQGALPRLAFQDGAV